MIWQAQGTPFDDLTRAIERFDVLFTAAEQQVMDAVAAELGQVTTAAAPPPSEEIPEPVPVEPGEAAVSLDTLAMIAALWVAVVASELMPALSLEYLAGAFDLAESARPALDNRVTRKASPDVRDDADLPTPDAEIPTPENILGSVTAEDYLAAARNRMVRFSDVLWEVARAQLLAGFMEGEGIEELRDRLRAVPGITAGRAATVARTEVVSASNAGSITMVRTLGFTGWKVWQATEDERTRETHSDGPIGADGQRVALGEMFIVGGFPLDYPGDPTGPPQEIINCVVGSTEVAWPRQSVSASTRRSYSGPLFELITANGHVLTVTPNHPILTTRGYIPAQSVNPGDQVFTTGDIVTPDVADVPPTAEQFHGALRDYGMTSGVIGRAVNFHGDIPDSEVEVVRTNRNLRLNRESIASGDVSKELFLRPDHGLGCELASGYSDVLRRDIASGRDWISSPSSDVRPSGQGAAITWGQCRHADEVGLATRTHLKPEGFESALDGGSADADFASHTQDALTIGMTLSEVIEVNASLVDHVDVYNLSTSRGWYISNGILSHNCRCSPTYELTDDDEPITAGGNMAGEWIGVLALEGVPTGDVPRRMFMPGVLSSAELPLPLLWQRVSADGHDGSVIVGDIRDVSRMGELIPGKGTFDLGGPDGVEAHRMVREGYLRGISIDADNFEPSDVEYIYGPGPIDPAGGDGPSVVMTVFHAGRLRGATLCAIPAFAEARISLMSDATDALAASEVEMVASAAPEVVEPETLPALTAAAYVLTIPDVPPAEWFAEPNDVDIKGALTVTDEGRVYGYLAPAGVDHRSFAKSVRVPMGNVDYSLFMGRETIVAGGGRVVTGALTMDCGHASTGHRDPSAALDHYDNACSIVATVSIGENAKGVWVAGALVPGVDPNQIVRMMACQLSGDWRPHRQRNGWREFAGALLVPVPGFAMTRTEASVLTADGEPVEVDFAEFGNRVRFAESEAGELELVASAVPVEFVHAAEKECGCDKPPTPKPKPNFSFAVQALAESLGLDKKARLAHLRNMVNETRR